MANWTGLGLPVYFVFSTIRSPRDLRCISGRNWRCCRVTTSCHSLRGPAQYKCQGTYSLTSSTTKQPRGLHFGLMRLSARLPTLNSASQAVRNLQTCIRRLRKNSAEMGVGQRAKVELIPWDYSSDAHVQRMYDQRVACGWRSEEVDHWKRSQACGLRCFYWIVGYESRGSNRGVLPT